MQFMGKDKMRLNLYIFSITILVYSLYLFYDHSHQGNEWNKDFVDTKLTLANKEKFSAVLLGGSNVVYSLSAEQLGNETKFKWFNLWRTKDSVLTTNSKT